MSSQCRKSSRLWRWLPVMLPMTLSLALFVAASVASAAPAAVADHVVISEVVSLANTATNRPLCSEFVEIHNPTAAAIDLGQYHLTDATFTTNNQAYWRIAEAVPSATTAGGGSFADFHARFPTGYAIAAGDTIVIAIAGSTAYQAAYGRLPDFELYEDGAVPDDVPELVEVFPGSVNAGLLAGGANAPTLTDSSESLVLYRWDGTSDLVQDVDYVRWGPTTSFAVDKTGVTVGASTYLADTAAAVQQTIAATTTPGIAYVRQSADEGNETVSGGNGLTGHNETSENFTATWSTVAQNPPLAPGAAYAAAPIITDGAQSPATPVTGEAVTVSVTALSPSAVSAVVFHYTVDGGADNQLAGVAAGADTWSAVVPAQAQGAVVRWYAVVSNVAGSSATYPAAAPRFVTTWTVQVPTPPVITAFGNSPATPSAGLSTTISVTATSLSALTGAQFRYSVNGGAFTEVAGTDQGGGTYTAVVPGQAAGAVVNWYAVVASQALLSTSSPADAPTSTHTWTVSSAVEPKLLLTEVCTLGSDQEFIEIWNPNAQSVNLSDYYLTDAVRNDQGYWNMGGGTLNAATIGGGAFNDFTARFPAGFEIAAGDTIVVSIAGSVKFAASYGFLPDLELYEDDVVPDAVPDMLSVFPEPDNSIVLSMDALPSLTNGGETVVLFKWIEGTDLVVDVDVFVWLTSTTTSYLFSKTGRTVGASTYLPETATAQQTPYPTILEFGNAYARVDGTEGDQVMSGSNGVGGSDEVSEDWATTWTIRAADPSRSNIAPPSLEITAAGQNPGLPGAGIPVTVSVTAVSASALTGAVFHYSVDSGEFLQLTGTAQGGGVYTAIVPGQPAEAVVSWFVVVTNEEGASVSSPANAPASTYSWISGLELEPKLLLTEICPLGNDQEFIEIWNPTPDDIDMSDYYLTDAIHSPADTGYWNIGGGVLTSEKVGGGTFNDFTARFPSGFVIASGDTIVVSIAGSSAFVNSFGSMPDIELYEDGPSPDGVPDMRSVFPEPANSIITSASIPGLTNAGEPVILFRWTEGTALVVDVDIFISQTSSTSTYLFSKTGKTVAGETYAPETAVSLQRPYTEALDFGYSYVRRDEYEGAQTPTGSNGIGGRDELSEDWNATWRIEATSPSGKAVPSAIELVVPAKTFLPSMGEIFPIRFVSRPGSETRLRLYDREGRLVRALYDSRFSDKPPSTIPGDYTTITWNGLDETYQRVSGGMYVLHLSVVNESTGVEETRTAPVVVTTRLSR